jgi:hypothetical protein
MKESKRPSEEKPTDGEVIFLKAHGMWHPGITAGEACRLINAWADLHYVKYKE